MHQYCAVRIAFAMACMVSCLGRTCEARTMNSDDYPGMQWGYTTQNFLGPVSVSLQSSLRFVEYAREQGFQWLELRDPDASLTLEECQKIAAEARVKGIEINYVAQRGLLDDDFRDVFGRAAVNAAVFDGPRCFRALALRGAGSYGWSEAEFKRLVEVANETAERAAAMGLRFVVENADAALDGRGKPYFGMIEFLEATPAAVNLLLDTANLFTGPVQVSPEEARDFIERYAGRISYLHLKSAQDGAALQWLDGNPLGFKTILDLVYASGVRHIAIELGSDDSEESILNNMHRSIEYLDRTGMIRFE
jgi:sugar phosphate isomerase/epimerase